MEMKIIRNHKIKRKQVVNIKNVEAIEKTYSNLNDEISY